MSTPQQIQQDIERTRAELSHDVDRLSEKVSPSKVVGRRVDRVKGAASSVRDRVMGSDTLSSVSSSVSSSASSAGGSVGSVASSVGDAASTVGEKAQHAPQAVRQQTQGNPLAAGLIAFGVGWLASSLLPATQAEQRVAEQAQERLAEPLKEKAQELAGSLQEPLQHSAEQIRATATDAAQETAEQAKSAAADVKDPVTQ